MQPSLAKLKPIHPARRLEDNPVRDRLEKSAARIWSSDVDVASFAIKVWTKAQTHIV
jgi:hypothetical protein